MKLHYTDSHLYYEDFNALIRNLCENKKGYRVCDIGGGAKPNFSIEEIEQLGVEYTVLDISQVELDKADARYKKVCADITNPPIELEKSFDLVFSVNVAEHITDADKFHESIKKILSTGGYSVHIFPTLYTFPFFINKIAPERLAAKILHLVSPRDRVMEAKFPAYYKRCRGPIDSQIKFYNRKGFAIDEYKAMYGHSYLYKRIPFLLRLHTIKSQLLMKLRVNWATSYAMVVLRKT